MITSPTLSTSTITERFDKDDRLHQVMAELNAEHGAGEIIGLVYHQETNQARGVIIKGAAIRRKDNTYATKAFSIQPRGKKFELNFLAQHTVLDEDYFKD